MNNLEIFVLCIIVCNGITFAFPQDWLSSSSSKQGYDWAGKGGQDAGKGFGDDSEYEMLQGTILEQNQVIFMIVTKNRRALRGI